MLGHSEEEVAVIASIARYHRGSEPKESHEAYFTIAPEERKVMWDMAAIVRLAEALDRSHRQVVKNLLVTFDDTPGGSTPHNMRLSLIIVPGENAHSEVWALNEKKSFFEDRFRVKLELSVGTEKVSAR
jgi:exopolyphosphatase/guanosine-5'-triphosphate,3'-diphosphate pyrophosphatase